MHPTLREIVDRIRPSVRCCGGGMLDTGVHLVCLKCGNLFAVAPLLERMSIAVVTKVDAKAGSVEIQPIVWKYEPKLGER